jgi:hypothetical protein
MDPSIDSFEGYDPIRDTSHISPLDTRSFSTNLINHLYLEEQLTQDEYLVLDFLGATTILKEGEVTMSFQGLKRLISLHQARLTKAVNRLLDKNMLEKVEAGYMMTDKGKTVFRRLFNKYRKNDILPSTIYSHISRGIVQGPELSSDQYENLAEAMVGKWFGRFRFTSKIDYDDSFEISWISTNGSISASLIVGPENNLRLSISAPIYAESQTELQLLMNHVSQSIESVLDAPVVFNSHGVYENRRQITSELDDAMIRYAG